MLFEATQCILLLWGTVGHTKVTLESQKYSMPLFYVPFLFHMNEIYFWSWGICDIKQKSVQNRFVSNPFWTLTTFSSQGTWTGQVIPGPGGGWTSGHDWIWGLLDLFLHLIKNATEADIYRAGKACVRRGAGKCCGRCCGCNGRRGWWSWRYGSSCRTAEAAEGEDPAGSLYRGWYVHLLSLSFVLSLSLFLSDALALPCSLFFFLCLFFPDIS